MRSVPEPSWAAVRWIALAPATVAVRVRKEPSDVVRIDAVTPAFALLMASRRPFRLLVVLVRSISVGVPPTERYSVLVSVGATLVAAGSASPVVMVAVDTDASVVTLPITYVPAVAPLPLMAAVATAEVSEDAVSAPAEARF